MVLTTVIAAFAMPGTAQRIRGSSATNASAEITKGKLSPADSKPGDQVTMRLKDDLKSNGEVVLKKGTTITGVVRNVQRIDAKSAAPDAVQSMMEIVWLAPAGTTNQLMVAVQSVTHVNKSYAARQDSDADWAVPSGSASTGGSAQSGGLVGGTLSATSNVIGGIGGVGKGALESTTRVSMEPNKALMSMPSIVRVDAQTAASLQNSFGLSGDSQLYHTGKGELVTAGGSRQSLEIFSYLNNDTVLTSKSKNFEITSGAQMQLIIGVRKY